MAKIQYIKDKENVTVYPVTHERAVRDSNNVTLETKLGQKQESLVSGTNIKTINNESILGSGNLSIVADVSGKQDVLVSGTNIKTINNTSLLGSGNISVQETLVSGTNIKTINNESIIGSGNLSVVTDISGKQDTLVSGTNIKTINNTSILGSGNLEVITDISGKQDALVSGTNIKTVNGESLLGSGNIIAGDPNAVKYTTQSLTSQQKEQARTNIGAQDALVSGTNLKTINQNSLLGSGDITIENGEDGVGFESISTPTTPDGTILITLTNSDTITLDLNHDHAVYPKYTVCTQSQYNALATKDSDTLYLIPET